MAGPYVDPRAHALRASFHQRFGGVELPVPVDAIARDYLGLDIRLASLPASGLIVPPQRRIWINADEPLARRRFTIAHEIGHWVCQCLAGRGAEIMCREAEPISEADRSLEREANIFAANLLMPEAAVRDAWQRHGSVDALADAFGVSGEAMQWRLFGFGLVGEGPQPWGGDAGSAA